MLFTAIEHGFIKNLAGNIVPLQRKKVQYACNAFLEIYKTDNMSNQKQIQIQFKLNDVRQVQFATLCNEWPEGELQVGNQINFSSDTQQRLVRCLLNVEYKKNDITQLILGVETVFEFSRESWSSMYDLNGDQWILPVGLVHHMADITIGSARGILAMRTEDAGFPRAILPMVNPQQFMRDNLCFKRNATPPMPSTPKGEA